MPSLGAPELLIILVIIALIFGVGRLGDIGGALGRSIKEFKSSVKGENEEEELSSTNSVDDSVSEKVKS